MSFKQSVMAATIAAVKHEIERQDEMWGEQFHPDLYWQGIMLEEMGEVSKCIIEGRDPTEEMIQASAVMLNWLIHRKMRLEAAE